MSEEQKLVLYKVLPKYNAILRDKEHGGDERIYQVENGKEGRPFVGIITLVNNQTYLIPLTKYKARFKYLTAKEPDFTPIYRKGKMIAGIEFNRMIPVPLNQVRLFDNEIHLHDNRQTIEEKEKRKYEENWCNKHKEQIIEKAQTLYNLYLANNRKNYKNIDECLDFPALEKICKVYAENHKPQHAPNKGHVKKL